LQGTTSKPAQPQPQQQQQQQQSRPAQMREESKDDLVYNT